MPTDISLIIGGVTLPVLAELILWAAHKAGMTPAWDKPASYVIAVVFAVIVLTMNFFPQYSQPLVGAVTFLYTLLSAMHQFFGATLKALSK